MRTSHWKMPRVIKLLLLTVAIVGLAGCGEPATVITAMKVVGKAKNPMAPDGPPMENRDGSGFSAVFLAAEFYRGCPSTAVCIAATNRRAVSSVLATCSLGMSMKSP